ncbi:MAG: hypothetical protein ACETWM_20285 [Candidatus Lokiarchaeia archaeon]
MSKDKDKDKDCEVCAPKEGEYDFEELKKLTQEEPPEELDLEELKSLAKKESFGKKK